MTTVTFDPQLLESHCLIDVRTPLEYEEDHIPGAVNVPLLTNVERVEIGTLYKQTGPFEARKRALELVAHRFPAMVASIGETAGSRPILVYCWRGGLRSKTMVSILDLTGYPAYQLIGGYKAYRAAVTAYFEPFIPPGPLVVIHGMTGIGKTTLLHRLGNTFSVLDLEGMASHRGSAFGSVGLRQTLSQKRFESLLWHGFRTVPAQSPIIIEGESRRIGKVSLPGNMYEVMQQSAKIWCEASLDTRVMRLIEEYGRPEYREEMAAALLRIRKKLGGVKYEEIAGFLDRGEMEPFMKALMTEYYDKVYYKVREWREDAFIDLEDFAAAEEQIRSFLNSRFT